VQKLRIKTTYSIPGIELAIDMDSSIEDTQPEVVQEIPVSTVFVPPSIHRESLVEGASYTHYTSIPPLIKISKGDTPGTECVLGVDEAGRGPVIGPMVYGAFFLPIELHRSLLADTHHFDDSKVLTPAVRASLMKAVCTADTDLQNACGWSIKSLSARDIGAGMLKNGGSYNLNAQAMDATVEIIRGVIDSGVNVTEIYIDTIGNPSVYQKKLERIFPTVKITVEKKADSLYPCVSAASVVAKVTRDVSCEVLYEEVARTNIEEATAEEASWGSGYPSDARCVAWLKNQMDGLFGWGNECRFSWGTIKDILDLKGSGGVKVDWPADEDQENTRLSDYFLGASAGPKVSTDADQLRIWFGSHVGQEAF
jgi:ribonuclease H2 subunit A